MSGGLALAVLAALVLVLAMALLLLRLEGTLRVLRHTSGEMGGQVQQGLQQANQTFGDVLQRLAVIDEAQRTIQSLTHEVVGLEALLGDKRARGAFGEVQLEGLVRNILPAAFFDFQVTLSTGVRADCVLLLPEPTGRLAVDAKFPLENYRRSLDATLSQMERQDAHKRLRGDIRAHIDAISSKYIVPGETASSAVMFVPAESLFAEIHGELADLVEYAHRRNVWIASPTTLFAVLHTAAALIKDARTRAQADQIRVELGHLAVEFGRFDQRLQSLARHFSQLGGDLESLQVSGRQLSRRFNRIESHGMAPVDEDAD